MTNEPTFKQTNAIEAYLHARQELEINPTDEVKEVVVDHLRTIQAFMSPQEIEELEEEIEPAPSKEVQAMEFALQLPSGWIADDFELVDPQTAISLSKEQIVFTVVIQKKEELNDPEWEVY